MGDIQFKHYITLEEYDELRRSVGWNQIERAQALAGLKNSRYVTVATAGGQAVGMARLVGDGGYVNLICDVIVREDYQGHGIGKRMVRFLLDYIWENLSSGQSAIVYVMSAKGKEPFYESLGFVTRPTDKLGSGMTVWIDK